MVTMAVEILPLGGLGEVGKNMTAITVDGECVVVDMGIKLDSILAFDDADMSSLGKEDLLKIDAIPDDSLLRGREVKAIVLTHGHLDHIGAVSKLAYSYGAPIYGTPFTIELAKRIALQERGPKLMGRFAEVMPGDTVTVGGVEIELIPAAHSIPQTIMPAIHTEDGAIICSSDFKLDDDPLLGYRTDCARLRRLSGGVLAAMVGAVRVDEEGPTPSESRARDMLRDVMAGVCSGNGVVLVTTFSSHIARIKSIVDLSFELGRTPAILGRSLHNCCSAAIELGLVDFPPELKIYGRPNNVHNFLSRVEVSKRDYVLIVSGHQGEPTSLLARIANRLLPLRVGRGDEVIFSASVIPSPINESNRAMLEAKLLAQGAEVHRDVHVSGHAARADIFEFLKMVEPEHLIPCHGTFDKLGLLADIGRELGYPNGRIHILRNGETLQLGR